MKKTGVGLGKALEKYAKGKKFVRAGFIDEATYPDGTSVAQVAYWNEYGTETSPPRPFFRQAVRENSSKWQQIIASLLTRGETDLDFVLDHTGKIMAEDIRTSIFQLDSPANSEVTALLKDRFPTRPWDVTKLDLYMAIRDVQNGKTGGNHRKPLIWSGIMSRRVNYEVSEDES